MNYKEFLTKLSKTARDWYFTGWEEIPDKGGYARGKIIRRVHKERITGGLSDWLIQQCPITSLTGESCYNVIGAIKELELDDSIAREILNAADNNCGHDSRMRADLLESCGLVEND